MKHLFLSLCFIMCALGAQAQEQSAPKSIYKKGIQEIINRGVLRVALYHQDVAPFFMVDDGEFKGIDVENARAVAKELGVKVEFNRNAKSFNEIVNIVARGEADLAFSKLSFTFERGKKVFYTKPYVLLRKAIMLNRLRFAQVKSKRTAKTLNELLNHEGAGIAVIGGSSYEAFMAKLFPKAKIVGEKTWMPGVWQAVVSRDSEVLAASRDDWEVSKILRLLPEANLEVQPIFLKGQNDEIRAIVTPENPDLHDFVENYIGNQKIITVDDILTRYSQYLDKISGDFRELSRKKK